MPETRNAYSVPQKWTDLTAITPVSVGASVVLQNVGFPADLIGIAIAAEQPADDFIGVALNQLNPMAHVKEPIARIWVRFYRFDDMDKYPSLRGILQVQEAASAILLETCELSAGSLDNLAQVSFNSDYKTRELLSCVLEEIKLLNIRFEENFNTRI